jgi:hypothetical protein
MTHFLENNDAAGALNIRQSSDMPSILIRERFSVLNALKKLYALTYRDRDNCLPDIHYV